MNRATAQHRHSPGDQSISLYQLNSTHFYSLIIRITQAGSLWVSEIPIEQNGDQTGNQVYIIQCNVCMYVLYIYIYITFNSTGNVIRLQLTLLYCLKMIYVVNVL